MRRGWGGGLEIQTASSLWDGEGSEIQTASSCPAEPDKKHRAVARWGIWDEFWLTSELDAQNSSQIPRRLNCNKN